MGLIRKTLSISTLGIVDFRSKKEQLRRAEKARLAAQAELIGEQAARAAADQRIAAAEKRARQSELLALQQAKKAGASRGRRRKRGQAAISQTIEALEGLVASGPPAAEARAKDLGRRGRKAAAKAAKRAEAAAGEARKAARKRGRRARKDDAVERGGDMADQARGKAADLTDR